jgi:hypothetical protein
MDVVKVGLDGAYVAMARRMLQMFHQGDAKVGLDVAFVAMATHVCCKYMFQMFDLFQLRCCIYIAIPSASMTVLRNLCRAIRLHKVFVLLYSLSPAHRRVLSRTASSSSNTTTPSKFDAWLGPSTLYTRY